MALEALKERQTLTELATRYEVHPNQISTWKREFLEGADRVFAAEKDARDAPSQVDINELFSHIGQLKVENEYLKKTCARPACERTQAHDWCP